VRLERFIGSAVPRLEIVRVDLKTLHLVDCDA
jgi:hypothetical protein